LQQIADRSKRKKRAPSKDVIPPGGSRKREIRRTGRRRISKGLQAASANFFPICGETKPVGGAGSAKNLSKGKGNRRSQMEEELTDHD